MARRNWTDITEEQQVPRGPMAFSFVHFLDALYRKLAPDPYTAQPREQAEGGPCCAKNDAKTARDCKLCGVPTCIYCRGLLNGTWICPPCRDEIKARLDFERSTSADFPRAFVGGLALSVVFGILWGALTVVTKHEFSFVAIVLGIAAGFGVHAAARGKRGLPIQLAAMFSAMISIAVGIFAMSVYVYNLGVGPGSQISVFDPRTILYFVSNPASFIGIGDIFFMLLAGAIAFIVPRPRVIAVR